MGDIVLGHFEDGGGSMANPSPFIPGLARGGVTKLSDSHAAGRGGMWI